jgi:hypothetical protein
MPPISIEHLYISPGHNFFGHHGQPAGANPLREVTEIECIAGRGVRCDRFFDYKEGYKGQIAFFQAKSSKTCVTRSVSVTKQPVLRVVT